MSMTISASNYWNVAYQTTKTDSTKTDSAEKLSLPETGKTQQSTVSASLDQVNLGEDGVAITEVSRQQGSEQTTAKYSAPHMDRVEISAEGQAASAKLTAQQSETDTEEAYEAEDLSEYTDTELKQMYYNGEITLQEYEDETGKTLE